jgi:endonuclease/exonuclease/phosphatase family metal-dependent hydrolase
MLNVRSSSIDKTDGFQRMFEGLLLGIKWFFASVWQCAMVLIFAFWISPADALTLLTWNVAEISDPDPERIHRLLNVARAVHSDLIFLQEVESETFRALKQEKVFGPDYLVIYEERRDGLPNGGLMILAKRELNVNQPQYHVLPSEMGRGVLMVSFTACGSPIHVANLHLESPDLLFWRSLNFRHQQIDRINQLTKAAPHWILAGDFNPVFEKNPDHLFSEEWVDAWREQHPKQTGLTWVTWFTRNGHLVKGKSLTEVHDDQKTTIFG